MRNRFFALFSILIFSTVLVFAQDPAAAGGYMLGPGDVVTGGVHGEMGYDFVATVDEDGMLAIPFIKKPVAAQCRTERDLKAEIETEVRKYLREPNFSFRVSEKHSRPTVSVAGEIMKQMEITFDRRPNATLIEILSKGGGLKEEASGQIQVFRPKPPICIAENDPDNWKPNSNDPNDIPSRTYSYAKVLLGKEDSNPTIYPGDQIVIKRAAPVYVTGEVVGGQGVFLKENGLSLAGAIAMVGGSKPEANLNNISIYRLKPGADPYSQDRDLIAANLKLIRKGKQKDVMLQPYDLVVVDKARKPIGLVIADIALNAARSAASTIPNTFSYKIIY